VIAEYVGHNNDELLPRCVRQFRDDAAKVTESANERRCLPIMLEACADKFERSERCFVRQINSPEAAVDRMVEIFFETLRQRFKKLRATGQRMMFDHDVRFSIEPSESDCLDKLLRHNVDWSDSKGGGVVR
jgi:hypothetical protein